MPTELHEVYASENGDRWSLGLEAERNRLFVLHEANLASGGARTEYQVESFLTRDVGSPQHQALTHLLATVRNT